MNMIPEKIHLLNNFYLDMNTLKVIRLPINNQHQINFNCLPIIDLKLIVRINNKKQN